MQTADLGMVPLMRFEPGRTVLRRCWRGGRITFLQLTRVVADDERVVDADRSWRWKDEEEFAAKTGHPLYWTAAQAAQIRQDGEQLAKLAEAGVFPFDGTWCDWRPDPAWATQPGGAVPQRTAGWDRPRAV